MWRRRKKQYKWARVEKEERRGRNKKKRRG